MPAIANPLPHEPGKPGCEAVQPCKVQGSPLTGGDDIHQHRQHEDEGGVDVDAARLRAGNAGGVVLRACRDTTVLCAIMCIPDVDRACHALHRGEEEGRRSPAHPDP